MPTSKQVEKAITIMSRQSANVVYFFSQLCDPAWIQPLKERGLLSVPPELIPDENGNLRGVHAWPQADYLKRMAGSSDLNVQNQILEIMLEAGQTNNYFIHRHFAEGVLQMPADLAEKWAKHEITWLREGNDTSNILEDMLGKLMSKLAKEGKIDTALELAEEVLMVFPDPEAEKKKTPKDFAEEVLFSTLHPKIRCQKYNYEEIIKEHIPDLLKADPLKTFYMLCRLLDKAVEYALKEGKDAKPKDILRSSRPAIEDSDQNFDYDFTHDLINAVRDSAELICRKQSGKLTGIIRSLEDYDWYIFRRIALYLLQVSKNPPMELIEERLINEELTESIDLHHEYFHLMRQWFDKTSPAIQERIMERIEKGEDLSNRDNLTPEQKEQWHEDDQWRRLSAIKDFLTGDWKQRFQELDEKYGKSDMPPDFHTWHGGPTLIGPSSPKSSDELAELSIQEQIKYFKEWKPPDDRMAPTPAGLGGVLSKLVKDSPDKYADNIELFMDDDLEPTYVRCVISGFCEVLMMDKIIPYEHVFKLCKWIVDKPIEIPGLKKEKRRLERLEKDTNWKMARSEISRLLERVFHDKFKLPLDLKEKAWEIIEPLTDDPDPTLEDEEKYGGNNMDPLHLSINSARGKALHSVMHYTMWVCRRIQGDLEEKENRKPSFKDFPEVKEVLEKHLDVNKDKTQTSRAVYGQWIPQLILIDEKWMRDNVDQIFPKDPELLPLRESAWDTFLLYSALYGPVFDVLKKVYEEEVKKLSEPESDNKGDYSPKARLVEHLITLYVWGKVDLKKKGMMDTLFNKAMPELKAKAIDFVGRRQTGKSATDDKTILDKYIKLWQWREKMVGGIDKMPKEELSAFGWWFACGKFDDAWTFPRLEKVLEKTDIGHSNLYVFEHMAEIFNSYPEQSLKCLRLFMKVNRDAWFFYPHRKEGVWQILEQGIQHDNSKIREESENIIHELGSQNHLEYRELLKRPDRGEKHA